MENIPELLTILSPARTKREQLDLLAPRIRQYLAHVHRAEPITTDKLVEMMFPEALARGEGIHARGRLYKVILYGALHDLADCCERGSPRRLAGRGMMIKPWLWSQSGQRHQESEQVARRTAEDKFTRDFNVLFRQANRKLGFDDAKRLAEAVIERYNDPAFAHLTDTPGVAPEPRLSDSTKSAPL